VRTIALRATGPFLEIAIFVPTTTVRLLKLKVYQLPVFTVVLITAGVLDIAVPVTPNRSAEAVL